MEAEKGREDWERIQQNESMRSNHLPHAVERNHINVLQKVSPLLILFTNLRNRIKINKESFQKPCSPVKESLDVNRQESMVRGKYFYLSSLN